MALINLTEVKTFLGISLASTTEDGFLGLVINAVDAEAKKYFDRQIETATYTDEYYCGTNNHILCLNEYPVTSVTSVRIDESGFWGTVSGSFATATALTS